MPTGFRNASSSDLPKRLQPIAERFAADLYISRKEGRSWPKKGVHAGTMAEYYSKSYSLKITDTDIRAVANWNRERGVPIGSDESGYWFCTTEKEYDEGTAHLSDRIRKMQNALTGGKRYFQEPRLQGFPNPLDKFLDEHPTLREKYTPGVHMSRSAIEAKQLDLVK